MPCEIGVPCRLRRREVYHTRDLRVLHEELKAPHNVGPGDPAHPLTAVPNPAAHPGKEEWKHALQGAAVPVHHHACPGMDDTDPGLSRRLGRGLPDAADLGLKARAQ